MSCSKVGGGGCVLKYDSAENKVRSESNVVMMEQRQDQSGARGVQHTITDRWLCYSEQARNLFLAHANQNTTATSHARYR
jgi:hypothetical protein